MYDLEKGQGNPAGVFASYVARAAYSAPPKSRKNDAR
jgi:hypothetical protein